MKYAQRPRHTAPPAAPASRHKECARRRRCVALSLYPATRPPAASNHLRAQHRQPGLLRDAP
ncbi:hypothetical protein UA70_19520 [Raoultella planticola]|nr:hypothetical protein UA70_19520 [Raoultella planticola]